MVKSLTGEAWIPAGVYPRENGGGNNRSQAPNDRRIKKAQTYLENLAL